MTVEIFTQTSIDNIETQMVRVVTEDNTFVTTKEYYDAQQAAQSLTNVPQAGANE